MGDPALKKQSPLEAYEPRGRYGVLYRQSSVGEPTNDQILLRESTGISTCGFGKNVVIFRNTRRENARILLTRNTVKAPHLSNFAVHP